MFFFNRILAEWMGVDLKDRRLWKGYQILWMDEKTNQTIKTLFIRPKNLILFLGFDFWGCLNVLWNVFFQFKRNAVLKMWSIFKKQCIIHRVRCGSRASKCIIFYLLTGMFLIALVEKLMPEIQLEDAVFSMQQFI